jgi:hypothetical protein
MTGYIEVLHESDESHQFSRIRESESNMMLCWNEYIVYNDWFYYIVSLNRYIYIYILQIF